MPGIEHLASKLSAVSRFRHLDLSCIRTLRPRTILFDKAEALIKAGEAPRHTYLLSSGWAISYRTLSSGLRQVIDFLIPGDFVGLGRAADDMPDYGVEAASTLSVMAFNPNCAIDLLKSSDEMRDAVLWLLAQERSILAEHLVNIGRRNAFERAGHLLLELSVRLEQSGICSGTRFGFPLALSSIADAVGLSEVHLSRTLKSLRDTGLIHVDFSEHRAEIIDIGSASALCDFNPSYLLWDPKPRLCRALVANRLPGPLSGSQMSSSHLHGLPLPSSKR